MPPYVVKEDTILSNWHHIQDTYFKSGRNKRTKLQTRKNMICTKVITSIKTQWDEKTQFL